jgi:D-alanyl-D-alanine carboxypeptidase
VYSTVADLARFASGVSGGDVSLLVAEMRSEVLSIQTPENDSTGYGLGFAIRTFEDGRRLASHGGSVAGYTAYLAFDPDARISVIVLRNYNSGRTNLGRSATGLLREVVAAQRTP